jgi:hypothetical protein
LNITIIGDFYPNPLALSWCNEIFSLDYALCDRFHHDP